MEEVKKMLDGIFYIATMDGNQPRVRPFDAAAIVEGKLYIGTLTTKQVYRQILENPKVEIFVMGQGMMRITAEAYPLEDEKKTAEIYEAMGKDKTKADIAVLELKKIKGTLADAMGGAPKEIDLA